MALHRSRDAARLSRNPTIRGEFGLPVRGGPVTRLRSASALMLGRFCGVVSALLRAPRTTLGRQKSIPRGAIRPHPDGLLALEVADVHRWAAGHGDAVHVLAEPGVDALGAARVDR